MFAGFSRGPGTEQRPLNDIDFVVPSFASIPGSLAGGFLVHHIHPNAVEGKTLLQLIDPEQGLRIDLFRQFGSTLSRTVLLNGLTVISLEDLVARTTSFILSHLRKGQFQHVGQVANLRADWQSAQTARVSNPRAG